VTLENTYDKIKSKFPNLELEPFEIVKSVNLHREFWKPKNVTTILLAESHVFTSIPDHDKIMNFGRFPKLEKCSQNYVRLVYCLGYGESLLTNVNNNRGTPQFWKIFASCVNSNVLQESKGILHSTTSNFYKRINNKIRLLEKLKEKGIWLVDASIVALYQDKIKPPKEMMEKILQISWNEYISKLITNENPEKIIVIGKGVANTLEFELKETKIPYYVQKQPQGIRSKNELKESFEKYFQLCNE